MDCSHLTHWLCTDHHFFCSETFHDCQKKKKKLCVYCQLWLSWLAIVNLTSGEIVFTARLHKDNTWTQRWNYYIRQRLYYVYLKDRLRKTSIFNYPNFPAPKSYLTAHFWKIIVQVTIRHFLFMFEGHIFIYIHSCLFPKSCRILQLLFKTKLNWELSLGNLMLWEIGFDWWPLKQLMTPCVFVFVLSIGQVIFLHEKNWYILGQKVSHDITWYIQSARLAWKCWQHGTNHHR